MFILISLARFHFPTGLLYTWTLLNETAIYTLPPTLTYGTWWECPWWAQLGIQILHWTVWYLNLWATTLAKIQKKCILFSNKVHYQTFKIIFCKHVNGVKFGFNCKNCTVIFVCYVSLEWGWKRLWIKIYKLFISTS